MPPHPSTVLAPAIFFATVSSPGRFLALLVPSPPPPLDPPPGEPVDP